MGCTTSSLRRIHDNSASNSISSTPFQDLLANLVTKCRKQKNNAAASPTPTRTSLDETIVYVGTREESTIDFDSMPDELEALGCKISARSSMDSTFDKAVSNLPDEPIYYASDTQLTRIHRLPNELLVGIFQSLVPIFTDWHRSLSHAFQVSVPDPGDATGLVYCPSMKYNGIPLALICVCKRWFEIIIHTPMLWSSFAIKVEDLLSTKAAASTLMRRSSRCMLDMILRFDKKVCLQYFEALSSAISMASDRFRRLEERRGTSHQLEEMCSPLSGHCSQVETLVIFFLPFWGHFRSSRPIASLDISAMRNLRTLQFVYPSRYKELLGPISIINPRATVFPHMRNFSHEALSLHDFLLCLKAFPELESCKVNIVILFAVTDEETRPWKSRLDEISMITHDRLHSLHINNDFDSELIRTGRKNRTDADTNVNF